MKLTILPVLLATTATLTLLAAQAGRHGWAAASSGGRDVLVGAALGVPAVQSD